MNRNDQLAARRAAETTGYDLHTDRPDIGVQVYTKPFGGETLLAKCFVGKAGKPTWFHKFRNPEQLAQYVERQIAARTSSIEHKAKTKAERQAPANVKVGDIFQASWGYDQTNIDYYQVTRVVGARTVEIRRIGAVSWETGPMQGRSVPAPDKFIGPPMIKRVKGSGSGYSRASIMITSYCDAYLIDPVVEGVPAYASSSWSSYH